MKIALVHDQLREFGGAERVLVALKKIFPQADVFTSTADKNSLYPFWPEIKNWSINVSWFGKIPIINQLYSPLRFLTPLIWATFDFSKYDLVISSSGSWMCKGINTKPPTIHISYIHHPPRYLYGYETAIEWQKYLLVKIYGNFINHFLRLYDYYANQQPNYLIANSEETKRRIVKFYRREAIVIYPPVKIPKKNPNNQSSITSNYFLTVSRLTRAKHIDILIKAANKIKFNLKIIGSGRDEKYLKSIAGPTVEFLGNLSDHQLIKLYQNARAFLFAAVDEEFGISPVEAMGYGLPVIAYASGGIPEYLQDNKNGFLYNHLNEEALIEKIKILGKLSKEKYLDLRNKARQKAENFSEENFKKNIINFITKTIKKNFNC